MKLTSLQIYFQRFTEIECEFKKFSFSRTGPVPECSILITQIQITFMGIKSNNKSIRFGFLNHTHAFLFHVSNTLLILLRIHQWVQRTKPIPSLHFCARNLLNWSDCFQKVQLARRRNCYIILVIIWKDISYQRWNVLIVKKDFCHPALKMWNNDKIYTTS